MKMQPWELLAMLVSKFQQWDCWVVMCLRDFALKRFRFLLLFGFSFPSPQSSVENCVLGKVTQLCLVDVLALHFSRADASSTAENRGELWGWQD